MRRRDPLAAYNERIKLRAGFLNALGLGFLGFAVLRPLVEGTFAPTALTAAFLFTGLALHVGANYILKYLEKED
ncbi:hypothetical protein RGUI_1862 [Rhodovulum sp. P5]|uniref:hypothetical protein n=1 Tax=Rhodovulum sp. P5 TaxID=1564506 RepID=UPI0009C28A5D|nr:hypothetical protein [Rhodovulum sp. P5]ARE40003.1 hypothetical protein RGUI_1862 [Rhodovulum sp. P5]